MKKTKPLISYALKSCMLFYILSGVFGSTAMAQRSDSVKILPSIYVPRSVSEDRKKWFNDHKYNILNKLAIKDGAKKEMQEVYIKDAKTIADMLDVFLKYKNMNGMRIYLGSRGTKKDETENDDKLNCGQIKLIMVPTKKNQDITSLFKRKYYTFNDSKLDTLYKKDSKGWAKKYQSTGGKRRALDSTLTEEDVNKGNFETKHIFFDSTKVRELKDEINYRINKGDVTGLKIRLVSYNDADSVEGVYKGMVKQNFKQRLTVDFVFTNNKGEEVYISDSTLIARKKQLILNNISSVTEKKSALNTLLNLPNTLENWNNILLLLNSKEFINLRNRLNNMYTMDTGVPAPPPYLGSDTMAELDIEP